MSRDEIDSDTPDDKTSAPKRIVVTHFGKKKKQDEEDVPQEIRPSHPSHIVSSPVDIAATPALQLSEPKKEEIFPPSSEKIMATPRGEGLSGDPILRSELKPESLPKSEFPSGSEIESEPKPEPEREVLAPEITPQAQISKDQPDLNAPPSASATGSASVPSDAPPPVVPPNPFGRTEDSGAPPSGKPISEARAPASVALFLSTLATMAVVALIFYAFFSQQELGSLSRQFSEDKSSVEELTHQAKQYVEEMDNIRHRYEEQQQALQNLKNQLENTQLHLTELMGDSDWVLAETKHLILMANERLQIAHDIPSAILALEAADTRLATLGNPNFIKIRETIRKDILSLKSAPSMRKTVMWTQLGALTSSLNFLHFKTLSNAPQKIGIFEKDENAPPWRKALMRSWLEFKGLIRVSREDENKIPQALTEQERSQILRTMALTLEQAKWAVLFENQHVYLSSLQFLQAWLDQYFVADTQMQQLQKQIQQLQKETIAATPPDISGSLQIISNVTSSLPKRRKE